MFSTLIQFIKHRQGVPLNTESTRLAMRPTGSLYHHELETETMLNAKNIPGLTNRLATCGLGKFLMILDGTNKSNLLYIS